jgi:hypothetical protein
VALKAFFVMLGLGLFQLVGSVTHGVFGFANGIAGLAFSLFCQTLGLSFLIACPLANLALNASSNVFRFSFNAFLVHKSPFWFGCSCSLLFLLIDVSRIGKAKTPANPSLQCVRESLGFKCLRLA